MPTDIICYGVTRGLDWQQEWYETSTRHAGKRSRALRKAGFTVTVSSMGDQITNVGRVKMTLLSVHNIARGATVPPPARIERGV